MCRWYMPTTIAWSRSYGSRVSCSKEKDLTVSTLSILDGEKKPTLRLDTLLPHIVNLTSKHLGRRGGRVDTVGLDGDDNGTAILEEVVRVEGNDTCLVGLGDVGKDDVDHLDEHSVFLRVSGVVDDGYSFEGG